MTVTAVVDREATKKMREKYRHGLNKCMHQVINFIDDEKVTNSNYFIPLRTALVAWLQKWVEKKL